MRCLNCRKDGVAITAEVCPHCGVYLPSLMRNILPPGTLLQGGNYRIDYALGQGGFGITYRAADLNLDRLVAIKEFYPQDYVHREAEGRLTVPTSDTGAYQKWLQRFEREGRILARLNHPGIVKVHSLFKERDTAYLVMELLSGRTLGDELATYPGRQLPLKRVIEVMSALVAALDTVHREGVYHLDLKPDNVMLTQDGRIVLVDFGAARQDLSVLGSSRTQKSTGAFTTDYAPPELIGGQNIGPATDLFELGMILHEMLTGKRPTPAWNRLLKDTWQPTSLEEPWRSMVMAALHLRSEERPQRVQEWWQAHRQGLGTQEQQELQVRETTESDPQQQQPDPQQGREIPIQREAQHWQTPIGPQAPEQQAPGDRHHRQQNATHQQAAHQGATDRSRAMALPPGTGIAPQQPQVPHSTQAQPAPFPSQKQTKFLPPPLPERHFPRRLVLMGGLGGLGLGAAWLLSQFTSKPTISSRPPSPSPAPTAAAPPLPQMTFTFEAITVNAQGDITNRRQQQARYVSENLGQGVTLDMVAIPAGEFVMGSPADELGRTMNEAPQHRVELSRFYIGRFQVTQAQWQQLMGNNPSHFQGDDRPVDTVSWQDAREFCQRLSQQTGRSYRLPSEAEWEYACRAETTTPFAFGPTLTTELANYDGKSSYGSGPQGQFRQETTPVGSFPANIFGLCDLHGNLWEWCEDVWHETYEGAPADGSAWVKDGDSEQRLVRGGSWANIPKDCRSALRNRNLPSGKNRDIGFRVVFS